MCNSAYDTATRRHTVGSCTIPQLAAARFQRTPGTHSRGKRRMKSRRSQEEPRGARRSQEQPAAARGGSQEEPGGAKQTDWPPTLIALAKHTQPCSLLAPQPPARHQSQTSAAAWVDLVSRSQPAPNSGQPAPIPASQLLFRPASQLLFRPASSEFRPASSEFRPASSNFRPASSGLDRGSQA